MKRYLMMLIVFIAVGLTGCNTVPEPTEPTAGPVHSEPAPTAEPTVPPATQETIIPPTTEVPVSQIDSAAYALIRDPVPELDSGASHFAVLEGQRCGPVLPTYVHLPMDTAVARQPYESGVFWVAENPGEMNQGNRYRAYVPENGQLVQLESRELKEVYTVLGRQVTLELAYVIHEDRVLISYTPAMQVRLPRATVWDTGEGVHACIVMFEFEENGKFFNYYASVDLETGVLTDILGKFDPTLFEKTAYYPKRWDGRFLLLSGGSANTWLRLDTQNGTVMPYVLGSLVPSVKADAFCVAGDFLLLSAYSDSVRMRRDVWQISLADGTVKQVLSRQPVSVFRAELPYLIYLDADRNYWILDLQTLEEMALPEARRVFDCTAGFVLYMAADNSVCVFDRRDAQALRLLPEAGEWIMELRESPDGRNILLYRQDENAVKQLLIFSGDADTVAELRRTNLNGANDGFCLAWSESGKIVVGSDNRRDFCFYTITF